MSVQMTSINAYYELKEEGKISERQELAFMAVRNFYDEKGFWPTPKEVHAFLAVEQGHELAQFEGPNLVKPRITELLKDPEDDWPDLLEKKAESRDQEYIEELLDDYESKKATPVKIAEDWLDRQGTADTEGLDDADDVDDVEDPAEVDGEGETGVDRGDSEEDVDDENEESVIIPSTSKDDTENDRCGDQENDSPSKTGSETDDSGSDSVDAGEVIYGSKEEEEDTEDATGEEDSEASTSGDDSESMTMDGVEYVKNEDGVWISQDEDEKDMLFPPDVDEDEYRSEDSDVENPEDLDEDQGQEDRGKEEKQLSLNQ